MALRRERVIPRDFVNRFLERLSSGKLDRDRAAELCRANDSPVARVFAMVVSYWGQPAATIRQAIGYDAAGEVTDLKRNVRVLNGTATLAPLLGLLGTVIGMIQSFDALGGRVGPAKGEALAQGISLALVTTALGLAIAIVSVAAYYYLLNRVDVLVRDLDEQRPAGHRPGLRRGDPADAGRPPARPRRRRATTPRHESRDPRLTADVRRRSPAAIVTDRPTRGGSPPMLSDRHQADELPHINMTPMVDVVLCLLVFFMAATRLYDWDENEFAVSVPEVADAAPLTAAPDDLTLTIVRPGKVAVGDDDLRPRRPRRRCSTKARDALRRPGRGDPGRRHAELSGPRRRPLRLRRRRHPQRPAPRPPRDGAGTAGADGESTGLTTAEPRS